MKFFLDTFVGDGLGEGPDDNAFRPEHGEGVKGIIDLRGDSTRQEGVVLVGADALVGTPLIDFGDTLDQRLNPNRLREFANRLGITLDQTDLRTVIAEIVLLHGRTDDAMLGSRWRRVKQTVNGLHEIFLGAQPVYRAPVIQGTAISESFNQADSSTLGPDLTWTEIEGNLATLNNEVRPTTNNDSSWGRADSDLDTDDHEAEVDVVTLESNGASEQVNAEVYGRIPSNGDLTGYGMYRSLRSTDDADAIHRILKRVTGTKTILAGPTTLAWTGGPETLRIKMDGSTITGYIDDVLVHTDTDTSITGNVRCGVRAYRQKTADADHLVRLDNFTATDLAAASVYPPFPPRQSRRVRM